MPGKLQVVSTPIGNLEDLSPRALRAFQEADHIVCEDTRRTRALLSSYGISKPLLSLHEHNERARIPGLLRKLTEGQVLALVSDAGTPLLSDPGFRLVREAAAQGISVEAIPGPSAILAALVVSGLPPYPFTFAGFPPPKRGKRRSFYQRLGCLDHTVVLFESPHRLLASLEDAVAFLGNPPAALARELTKVHEEVLRGGLKALLEELRQRPALLGEWTVVLDLSNQKRPLRPNPPTSL
jgi:16S rRNA (cytidine1402-2'-O)-methyltransferase